jgi:hypothetical protein
MNVKSFAMVTIASGFVAAHATVVGFDDIAAGTHLANVVYDGILFNTSTQNTIMGNVGFFDVNNDPTYSAMHSPPHDVYNAWGAQSLSFTFSGPVTFEGAWFSQVDADSTAHQVRFADDKGDVGAWTPISFGTSTWVEANFSGATTIFVERQGAVQISQNDAEWYAMDDITYVASTPEPATAVALACGMVAMLRRRKKTEIVVDYINSSATSEQKWRPCEESRILCSPRSIHPLL